MPVVEIRIPTVTRPAAERRPTREDLTSRGLTPAQADHELVRRNELEVIEGSFTRCVMCFGCIICLLLPISLGLFVYLVYGFSTQHGRDCDVPLSTWFYIVLFNVLYHLNFGGRSIHRQVIRTVCRYQADDDSLERPPGRVRLYHFLTTVFVFSWHCVGLHWISVSRTCSDSAPDLYKSVYLFAAFNVSFTLFTTISTIGLQQILAALLRRGLLPSAVLGHDRIAPEGTMDLQQTVTFDPSAFGDSLQCPTCLEDFGTDQPIKKTTCGHYFHEACLAQWFRMNRTCPLCRHDLAEGLEGGGPEKTGIVIGATSEVTPDTTPATDTAETEREVTGSTELASTLVTVALGS